MSMNVNDVKNIARILIFLLFIAGIVMIIIPILFGVGVKSGSALGVNTTATYNNSVAMVEDTSAVGSDLFTFLPWLGVGIVIAAAFGFTQL